MSIICKIFGHWMWFDTCDISGPSHCRMFMCDHREKAVEWEKVPMPEVKKPKSELCEEKHEERK